MSVRKYEFINIILVIAILSAGMPTLAVPLSPEFMALGGPTSLGVPIVIPSEKKTFYTSEAPLSEIEKEALEASRAAKTSANVASKAVEEANVTSKIVTPIEFAEQTFSWVRGVLGAIAKMSFWASTTYQAFDANSGIDGVMDKEDQRVAEYSNTLWTYFLNDPLFMGPSPIDPNKNYVRYVFEQAAQKVNERFAPYINKKRINPKRIFINESYFPNHKILIDPDENSPKAYFFIPATPFYSGDINAQIDKVALELGAQLAWMLKLSQVTDLTWHYDQYGHPKSIFNPADPLRFDQATRLFAAQILGLPAPDFKHDEFFHYQQEMEKYKLEFETRTPVWPNSLADFETRFMSFRKHRLASFRGAGMTEEIVNSFRKQKQPATGGPEMGEEVINPCIMGGQELILARPIPKCLTIHLSDVDSDNTISKLVQDVMDSAEKSRRYASGEKLLGETAVGVIMAGLVDLALSRYFGKLGLAKRVAKALPDTKMIQTAGRFTVGLTEGLTKMVVFGYTFIEGQKGTQILFKDRDGEGQKIDLDLSQLEQALTMLKNNWMYIDQNNYADQGKNLTLRKSLFQAFQSDDPDTIKLFESMAK